MTAGTFRSCALACVALGAGAPAELGDSRAEFEADLREVRAHMEARRWRPAKELLIESVTRHAARDYVPFHWTEIEESLAHCSFWSDYDAPEPEDVVSGELLEWNAKTGKIKLRYTPRHPGFRQRGKGKGSGDFVKTEDGMYLHPMVFTDTYHVEMKGKKFGGGVPIVLVAWRWQSLQGVTHGSSYAVTFGSPKTYVHAFEDGKFRPIDEKTMSIERNEPFAFKIIVSATTIQASYNRKLLVKTKRPKGPFGQFGFTRMGGIQEITIAGEVEPSWLAGLVDARVHADWKKFFKKFRPFDHLPAELESRVRGDGRRGAEFGDAAPRPFGEGAEMDPAADKDLVKAKEFHDEGEFAEGLAFAETVRGEIGDWLRAHFLYYNGKLPEALEHCRRVSDADPAFFESRLLQARLVQALESAGPALDEFERLRADFPEYVEAHEGLAMLHCVSGRLDEAERVLEDGIAEGMPAEALEGIARSILRSRHGPRWGTKYEVRSKNYTVSSDLGQSVCHEIADELEKFYAKYAIHIRRPEGADKRRFQVYFFAGNDGYGAYTEGLLGDPAENTLGLYSPWLKQLVIWNSEDKHKVMRTVRHEGFHQYFDRITSSAPVWLNEGMAEYYEQAELVRGRWKDDQVNEQHLGILRGLASEWTPLEEFVYQDTIPFRIRSGLHYPQAWAFVHYLSNRDRKTKKRLSTLLDALAEGASRHEALNAAFADVDWSALQRDFREYVREL